MTQPRPTMSVNLDTLVKIAEVDRLVDELVIEAVEEARKAGYSWAQIGGALGVSKQAAQQKYGSLHLLKEGDVVHPGGEG